jgi:DHA2 family multidrug resistance protein
LFAKPAGGLIVMAAGYYWMALMNLYISPWQVIWPRIVMIAGLSMIFAPLNVAAFKSTPQHLRGAPVGLLALAHRPTHGKVVQRVTD